MEMQESSTARPGGNGRASFPESVAMRDLKDPLILYMKNIL